MLSLAAAGAGCRRSSERSTSSSPAKTQPLAAGGSIRFTDRARFAVVGDYGADGPSEAAVARMIRGWNPDFVITTGDNNYPNGEASTIDDNIGKYYASFIGNYQGRYGPGSAQNRFWPSPGNHDWRSGLGPYEAYFTLPGNERYYDADLGLVHLYALDSDPQEPDGVTAASKQGRWLEERLHASRSCYDVVYFHHPPYSSGEHGSTPSMRWPFESWGAEVVFSGHDHTYEHIGGHSIPYFVVGLGGASRYDFRDTAPGSETRYNRQFGAMLVDVSRTSAKYEFWNVEGQRVDSLEVPRSCD